MLRKLRSAAGARHHRGVSDDAAFSPWARAATSHVAARSSGLALDRSLRITLNFPPDQQVGGISVVQQLGTDRVYRSQFETGTSNGGLTTYSGGDRWLWEQRMFSHAYDDAPASERPKYGALNHRRCGIGGAPRFGSAHLRLTEQVLARTTCCFPDSVFDPTDFGTASQQDLVRLADAWDERALTGLIEALEGGVPVEWHEGRRLLVSELKCHPHFEDRGSLRSVAASRSTARWMSVLSAPPITRRARTRRTWRRCGTT